VANVEGEGPDPHKLKMPGEEEGLAVVEPLSDDFLQDFQPLDATEFGDLPPIEEAAAAPPAAVAETEIPPPAPVIEQPEEVQEEPTPAPAAEAVKEPAKGFDLASVLAKSPTNITWIAAGGASLLLIVLSLIGLLYLATAIYLAFLIFVGVAIWIGRATNSVYTLMLACALVAVLTAVYCLLLELGRYNMDVKARSAKQHASISRPVESRFATLGIHFRGQV
jgi:uncharacterized membrane protein YphA (DoxX/SURF4 family)